MLEGIASYHFDAPDACYISYANAPPEARLDDGSAPPARKPFINPTFAEESRTFRGSVEWDVPFGGGVRWDCEMIFAANFASIVSGHIHMYSVDGNLRRTYRFMDPSNFGYTAAENMMCYVQRPGILN